MNRVRVLVGANPPSVARFVAAQGFLVRDALLAAAMSAAARRGPGFCKVGGSTMSIQKSPSTPIDALMSRREFVGRASAAGVVSAAIVSAGTAAAPAAEAPRKGGILRVGSAGGSTTDGLDPRTWTDSVTLVCGFTACNMLVENLSLIHI